MVLAIRARTFFSPVIDIDRSRIRDNSNVFVMLAALLPPQLRPMVSLSPDGMPYVCSGKPGRLTNS